MNLNWKNVQMFLLTNKTFYYSRLVQSRLFSSSRMDLLYLFISSLNRPDLPLMFYNFRIFILKESITQACGI